MHYKMGQGITPLHTLTKVCYSVSYLVELYSPIRGENVSRKPGNATPSMNGGPG